MSTDYWESLLWVLSLGKLEDQYNKAKFAYGQAQYGVATSSHPSGLSKIVSRGFGALSIVSNVGNALEKAGEIAGIRDKINITKNILERYDGLVKAEEDKLKNMELE
ncbi:hypothetical protein [Magnetospira sp. QH-2]|uniref:hypothetical protein n=1 Tax=Magnetospira sp. (strain QH-2) TaxID=1288970 RepID=UPI0003E80BFE|nr:hypothetical protein [Magnetospira sp. QH-2]CCQ72012.1 protein of unknown function [Magnetospira sp. QH-2]